MHRLEAPLGVMTASVGHQLRVVLTSKHRTFVPSLGPIAGCRCVGACGSPDVKGVETSKQPCGANDFFSSNGAIPWQKVARDQLLQVFVIVDTCC